MDKEALKKKAAEAALDFIKPGMIIGVGSGSTVDYFIEALVKVKSKIEGVVASSIHTAEKIKSLSIPLIDLNSLDELPLYIDGADEINPAKQMIKGGGGALTREKIIASVAKKFICIIDPSKKVDLLGKFPVAVEVLSLARSYVARQTLKLGASPNYRQGKITDNGNVIVDLYNLTLVDPISLEMQLNNIVGTLCNGIFAARPADIVLVGEENGVNCF